MLWQKAGGRVFKKDSVLDFKPSQTPIHDPDTSDLGSGKPDHTMIPSASPPPTIWSQLTSSPRASAALQSPSTTLGSYFVLFNLDTAAGLCSMIYLESVYLPSTPFRKPRATTILNRHIRSRLRARTAHVFSNMRRTSYSNLGQYTRASHPHQVPGFHAWFGAGE